MHKDDNVAFVAFDDVPLGQFWHSLSDTNEQLDI